MGPNQSSSQMIDSVQSPPMQSAPHVCFDAL
jgi:hypothetical protein